MTVPKLKLWPVSGVEGDAVESELERDEPALGVLSVDKVGRGGVSDDWRTILGMGDLGGVVPLS